MIQPASSPWRWLGTLFFAEGLPATAVLTLSAILFKRLQMPNEQIAFFVSALLLPWIARPLWSPLIEIMKTKRFFVIATELTIAASFLILAVGLSGRYPVYGSLVLLAVVAVAAATHDMAADGLYIAVVPPALQARSVGWLGVAFNAAKLTAQGLVVILAGFLEPRVGVIAAWRVVFLILGGLMAVLAWHHAVALPKTEPPRGTSPVGAGAATSSEVVASFFGKAHLVILILLVVTYRFSEGQLGRIAPLFILDPPERGGLGLSTVELGAFYGAFGAGAFMLGAVAGGRMTDRHGLRRILLPLTCVAAAPTALYLGLAFYAPRSLMIVGAALIAEQLAYGVASVGLKLVMMQGLAAGPFPSAHFAFAAGLVSLGMTAGGMISGVIQAHLGYRGFFIWALAAALPAVAAAVVARRRVPDMRVEG